VPHDGEVIGLVSAAKKPPGAAAGNASQKTTKLADVPKSSDVSNVYAAAHEAASMAADWRDKAIEVGMRTRRRKHRRNLITPNRSRIVEAMRFGF
jgi:hypothetical protein